MSQQPHPDEPLLGEVRFKVPLPILIPVVALAVIGGIAIGFARIFLSLPKEAAVIIAVVAAANILGAGAYIALRARVTGQTLFELLAIVAYPILIGVVIAAVGIGGEAGHGGEGEHGPAPAPDADATIVAANIAFDTNQLQLPAGGAATLALVNEDAAEHNVSIYETQEEGLALEGAIFEGEIIQGGASIVYEIPAPEPGDYYFQCDVHPNMNGTATFQ